MRRHGRTDTVVLYWFRTPPYVKVGRTALDPETRHLLEELYPDISFDWNRILREAPQPLPEHEAIRRKEQRDARDARRRRKRPVEEPESLESMPAEAADAEEELLATTAADDLDADFAESADVKPSEDIAGSPPPTNAAAPDGAATGKRRRRRRRRKRPGGNPSSGSV